MNRNKDKHAYNETPELRPALTISVRTGPHAGEKAVSLDLLVLALVQLVQLRVHGTRPRAQQL